LLDEQAQKVRDSLREALIGWAQSAGEASDYTDNLPGQCLHPVGHWFEVPNLLRNGTLRQMLADRPQLRYLMLHNIDTVGTDVSAAALGLHIAKGACLTFEVINRNVDQPYKYLGTWLIDQWEKVGLHVTQQVVPTGPWFASLRSGEFAVNTGGNCHGIVNPVIDVQTWLSHSVSSQNYGYYEDPKEDEIYNQILHETDVAKQRALAYQFDTRVLGEEAHYIHTFWWNRIVPYRSYMHGWKIGPSHYSNQDLSTIWLAPPKCNECSVAAPNGEKHAAATAK
jgi:hypothetical protein